LVVAPSLQIIAIIFPIKELYLKVTIYERFKSITARQYFLLSITLAISTVVSFFTEFISAYFYVFGRYTITLSLVIGCASLILFWRNSFIENTAKSYILSLIKSVVLICIIGTCFFIVAVSHMWAGS
jgi:hypothetical protein